MRFLVTVETDEEGICIAECPYLPGLTGEGKTPEEALANIQKAIEHAISKRRQEGHDPARGLTGPGDLVDMSEEAVTGIREAIGEIVRSRRNSGLPTSDIQIRDLEIEV